MLKLHLFTILLVASPSLGLLENLFRTENSCYSGCHANYAGNLAHSNACKKGCDYKIQNEHCASQCKSNIADQQGQASCLMGCSLSQFKVDKQHPRHIILIRLRQRPMLQLPSLNSDLAQTFSDLSRQLKSNELKPVVRLDKNIPIIKSTNELHSDSLSHKHMKIDSSNSHFQRFVNQLDSIIGKQPNIPGWILLGIFFLSSAILWKMIVSLCCHKPKHYNLSIHPQELVFDNVDQREKFQSKEQNI